MESEFCRSGVRKTKKKLHRNTPSCFPTRRAAYSERPVCSAEEEPENGLFSRKGTAKRSVQQKRNQKTTNPGYVFTKYLVRESSDVVTPHDKKLGEVPGDVSGHPGRSLEPREQRVRAEPIYFHLARGACNSSSM